jgi:signal peptidase I
MTSINLSLTSGPIWSPPVRSAWFVAVYLALVFVATSLVLPSLLPGGWNLYFAQPLLWGGLAALCLRIEPGLLRRPATPLLALALLAGLFEVGVFALAGLLYGFGHSTYAHALLPLLANLVYLGSGLVAIELARALLLRRWSRYGGPGFLATALVLAAINLNFSQWQSLGALDGGSFETAGASLLPATAESLLATLLVATGGAWAGIVYRGVPLAAEWLSPILPQLDWTLVALVGVLAPGLALMALQSVINPASKSYSEASNGGVPSWLVAAGTAIVAVIWLNTGLLGVRPALVSGASMEPSLFLGDIVFTRSVAPASLQPGDVIRFRSGDVSVLHRVVSVEQTPAGLVFKTQGDNNNFVDPPVAAADVEGRVVLRVPKLGLIPIALKTWLQELTS